MLHVCVVNNLLQTFIFSYRLILPRTATPHQSHKGQHIQHTGYWHELIFIKTNINISIPKAIDIDIDPQRVSKEVDVISTNLINIPSHLAIKTLLLAHQLSPAVPTRLWIRCLYLLPRNKIRQNGCLRNNTKLHLVGSTSCKVWGMWNNPWWPLLPGLLWSKLVVRLYFNFVV